MGCDCLKSLLFLSICLLFPPLMIAAITFEFKSLFTAIPFLVGVVGLVRGLLEPEVDYDFRILFGMKMLSLFLVIWRVFLIACSMRGCLNLFKVLLLSLSSTTFIVVVG